MRSRGIFNEMRIVADNMLGRLAVWLRLLGLDTEYLTSGPGRPSPDRILITRRADRPGQPSLKGWQGVVRVRANHTQDQLREAVRSLKLTPEDLASLTRCSRCNALLEPLNREAAFGRVPEFVFEYQTEFFTCPRCDRVYWPGTHQDRILAVIQDLFEDKSLS